MFRQILLALAVFVVIALIGLWLLSGGPRKLTESTFRFVDDATPSLDNIAGFRLPWQPVEIFPTLDITDALHLGDDGLEDAAAQLAELEAEYERLNAEAGTMRVFGNPSPYLGAVSIVSDTSGIRASEAAEEYIQLSARRDNSAGVDIAGWSLESALGNTRIYIPPGASPFLMGMTNVIGPVGLPPGGTAFVVSAPSPVGVSFRENACTGYLAQFQLFTPWLPEECPSPSSVLPLSEANIVRYGDTCFDIVRSLSTCEFPQNLPDTAFPACRAYLADALSYNGCVNRERSLPSFERNVWRVYLGASRELWRNSHDAIRLLDAQGRTVDVFVY
jgi:hypothetical protein